MDVPRADITPPASWPLPNASPQLPGPSLWTAFGLIGLYFLLQLTIGAAVGWVVNSIAGRPPGALATSTGQTLPVRSDLNAIVVIITLLIAAGCIIYLTRRLWPARWSQPTPPGLGFTRPGNPSFYVAALFIGLTMPVIGGLLTQLLAGDHVITQDIKQLGADTSMGLRIPLALMVISIGPLVEELLFRGALLSALMKRLHPGWAAAVCSLLFATVHLPDLSFLWYALPNLFLLAVALAWLRLSSGSIWPAVVAHGVNNMMAVVAWFVIGPSSG
ncbi:CPBP family intramembrane glutamic endopeptidase [Dyella silvatica]|uniref:CPBP family intramembrane glutamic endopeptidase n=1 Tax=Dyella silvatica TaxID=2992128 RepID=UPI00225760F5|nr:type II CAAX endopeptidase family protein [Dyella silvatica]